MQDRDSLSRLGLVVLSSLLVLGSLLTFRTMRVEAAAATLSLPSASCGGSKANVNFGWSAVSGATKQYLDVSVQDGRFQSDTVFSGYDVTGLSAFNHPNLYLGQTTWWRINSLIGGTWTPSTVTAFVPCGAPQPLSASGSCTDKTTGALDFVWAPTAGPGTFQYVDLGSDVKFAAGSFSGAGPLDPALGNYHWPNLKANIYYYYRINEKGADGAWHTSDVKSVAQNCASPAAAAASTSNSNCQSSTAATCDYASSDTLVIPSLNEGDSGRCGSATINAAINIYDVQADGAMGIPEADCDVVRENFTAFPSYGGYPGTSGTTVLAGHVDYHPHYQAVFWNLRSIQTGAEIDYYRSDGKKITYAVDWAQAIADPSYDWGSLALSSSPESLVLITCDGAFNADTHEYDHRFVAHAVRTN